MVSIKVQPHEFISLPTKNDAKREHWQWPTLDDAKPLIKDILKVSFTQLKELLLTEVESRFSREPPYASYLDQEGISHMPVCHLSLKDGAKVHVAP